MELLAEIFYWLLNMSISASITGAVVYLIRKIPGIPRRIVCALWGIPFFRMWVPIGVNSEYSLMSLLSKIMTRTIPIYEGSTSVSFTNFVMAADSYFPVTYKIEFLERLFQIAAVIWLTFAAALLLTMFLAYAVTKSALKDSLPFRDNIYFSSKITSPATYGIIHGKIILPRAYEGENLHFILLHEKSHIKRKDNLWRVIGLATVCMHWFNPLAWLFLKSFLADLEFACDESVLNSCGQGERKHYAAVLLHCAESKSLFASPFGGAKIRPRINRILSYKKLSALSLITLVTLAILIGYVLLTNSAGS